MEQRSVTLESAVSGEEVSPEAASATNVATSSAYSSPEVQRAVSTGLEPSSTSTPVIADTSPLSDSGYTEANSSTLSGADSATQEGSLESSLAGGVDAAVPIKEK